MIHLLAFHPPSAPGSEKLVTIFLKPRRSRCSRGSYRRILSDALSREREIFGDFSWTYSLDFFRDVKKP